MRVSQAVEQEDLAVVGGGEARAFKIGSSAQAFKILSDTLYSDKHRAVVREILCNAVDAHIALGIDSKPVAVKLSAYELSIQDFGPGIADKNMVDIYATYFGSTKIHDDTQTGGFGLGSKSPFAYTSHFTVTSCNAGLRRIYALTIADDDVGGAPAVKLMATAPCGVETGVTVSVPIDSRDHLTFTQHLRDVVLEGGMNVTLNGEKLETRDYTELHKHGIGLFGNTDYYAGPIQVLYGNVLYAMTPNSAIDDLRKSLEDWGTRHHSVILYALPSSVTVTPSREALSYNPRTIATLQRLMRRALHILTANRAKMRREACVELIERHKATRANVAHIYRGAADPPSFTKTVVGAVAMARFRARNDVYTHKYPIDQFLDVAGRYFGEKSKLLMGTVAPLHGQFYGKSLKRQRPARAVGRSFFQEQHQFVTRKLLRLVPPELWSQLHYNGINSSGETSLTRLSKSRIHTKTNPDPLNLIIGYTRENCLLSVTRGYFLIDPKITDAQIAAIKAAAPLFRFRVTVIPKAEPVKKTKAPKAEKPPVAFHSLKMDGKTLYARRGYNRVRGLSITMLDKPRAYLAWAPNRYKDVGLAIISEENIVNLFEAINQQIPDAVLGVGLREVELLKAINVPSVESITLDRLEKRIALNPVAEGSHCAVVAWREQSPSYYGVRSAQLLRTLSGINERAAYAAFGLPFDPAMTKSDSFALWQLAHRLFEIDTRNSRGANKASFDYAACDAHRTRFVTLCELALKSADPRVITILKKLRAESKGVDKYLPHLNFFAKIIGNSLDDDLDVADKTRLAEMIEAEIARLNPQTTPLDENGDQL